MRKIDSKDVQKRKTLKHRVQIKQCLLGNPKTRGKPQATNQQYTIEIQEEKQVTRTL